MGNGFRRIKEDIILHKTLVSDVQDVLPPLFGGIHLPVLFSIDVSSILPLIVATLTDLMEMEKEVLDVSDLLVKW